VISEIDGIIRGSLAELVDFVWATNWYGREREVISLFTFGFLLPRCRPESVLRHPTQVAIEGAVIQIGGPNRKKLVTKDMVIWPEPLMNVWDEDRQPANHPAAILEWKANKTTVSGYDVNWLRQFSSDLPDFVGYAVCLDVLQRRFRLSCTRVHQGDAESRWLNL
jgi:hypothetical protein